MSASVTVPRRPGLKGDVKKENGKADALTQVAKKVGSKKEEDKGDAAKKEIKKDEAKKDEAKKDETKKEEAKKDQAGNAPAQGMQHRHVLGYQDLLIYEQESKPGTFQITGRYGAEVDPNSPLAQLKDGGRLKYLERQAALRANNLPEEPDVYDLKLMIVITMYNENVKELKDSIVGLQLAIKELIAYGLKKEEIAVFLIADGYAKLTQDFLNEMTKQNLYDESKIKPDEYFKMTNGKRVDFQPGFNFTAEEKKRQDQDKSGLKLTNNVCHLFQAMDCVISINPQPNDEPFPCNFFFAIKHLNGGKLDSHFWFFKGFAEYLKPHYCFLVDIGTKPEENSLSKLVTYLDQHPHCGGVCGEIQVDMDEKLTLCDFGYYLCAGQFVEYKMSHFFDKAFESFFGFVSVLPGAFSGYRWVSIKDKPLTSYFKGLDKQDLDLAQGNMFLAEDRIMCVSILTNESRSDFLTYVPGARAVTDPPTTLAVLLKQRRRWINGSNFALLHVLANFLTLWKTKHTMCRKLIFTLFYIYQILLSILAFVIVGSSYASFSVFARHSFPVEQWYNMSSMLENAYLVILFLIIIWALCKPVDKSEYFYPLASICLGVLMCFMLYFTYLYFFQDFTHLDGDKATSYTFWMVLLLLCSMILPVVCNIQHVNRPCLFLLGFIVYTFLTPMYMNVFVIYSFCNTHDLTWGNRPQQLSNSTEGIKEQQQKQQKQQATDDTNKSVRTYVLVFFLIANLLVGYFVTRAVRGGQDTFIAVMAGYIVMVIILKLIFCVAYALQWCFGCEWGIPPPPRTLRAQADPKEPTQTKPIEVIHAINRYDPRNTAVDAEAEAS